MKRLVVVLLVITILAGGAVLYLRLGANLSVVSASIDVRPAADVLPMFEDLRVKIEEGSFTGEILGDADLSTPEGYVFAVYTLRLRNWGMLPAEWIRIEVEAVDGADVLALSESRGFSLAAFGTGVLSGTMLTRAEANTSRVITVRYYVYGRELTVSVPVRAPLQ